jgi:DNA-binding NarL/FixJ family response regulator
VPILWVMNAAGSEPLTRIRTMVVDDSAPMLRTICRFLETEENIEVVGKTTDPKKAIPLIAATLPNLVLVDLQMNELNGLELTQLIRKSFPAVRIVIVTVWGFEFRLSSRAAGAHGFVCKRQLHESLPAEIRRIFSHPPELVDDSVVCNLPERAACHD